MRTITATPTAGWSFNAYYYAVDIVEEDGSTSSVLMEEFDGSFIDRANASVFTPIDDDVLDAVKEKRSERINGAARKYFLAGEMGISVDTLMIVEAIKGLTHQVKVLAILMSGEAS